MFRKANILLLALSTIITSLSMLFLPLLLSWVLPPSMLESLEYQSWFLFGHLSFLYLITACFYALAGCFIGIKTNTYKDAIIKSIYVGLGLFLSLIIIGSLYARAFIFAWMFPYFIFTLPGVAVVILPALFIRFLRPRIKLNQYVLFAISSALIIIAYIPLSGIYTDIGKNTPEIDYMRSTPVYRGVTKQIVEDSQFQLERDLSVGEEKYLGFGSFPAISYHRESEIMISEFCHQHLDSLQLNEQYSITERTSTVNWIDCPVFPLVNKKDFDVKGYTGYAASWESSFLFRFEDFVGRPADIVILPGEPAESYPNNDRETVEIVFYPIAVDALIFFVHKDNPVDNLSTEQLRDIYAGNIRNWQELGGENKRIKNYQRDRFSYTQSMMEEIMMQGMPMSKPIQVNSGVGDMVTAFYQNYTESIGYCLLSFLVNDGYNLDGDIKILSIDGVQPDEVSIRSGKYPYITNFSAAIRKGEENDNGGRFLEWILSEEGQACIRQAGYLPLY